MEAVEQRKLEAPPSMTFDEASLERTKSFVNALQELKNLRPQLYSAAEYCEKSYLHSEQKQMVLDNMKDYAVRALVNAVDHLGTVAYKLNGILEQQTIDLNTMDLKLITVNQQILTCQTYMGKEGLRQQRLLAIIPRHHKRYILPNSVSKKVHFGPTVEEPDSRQSRVHARRHVNPSGSLAPKALSWHLASESKPSRKRTLKSSLSSEVMKNSSKSAGVFHLLDKEGNVLAKSSVGTQPHTMSRNPASGVAAHSFGTTNKDLSTDSRSMTPFRSFNNSTMQQQIIRAPPRTKSVLSAFFAKQKIVKLRTGTVA